jgi:signal transduction histidine kinase
VLLVYSIPAGVVSIAFVWQFLRAFRVRETIAVRAERERLARELHDTVAQDLVGIALMLQAARVRMLPSAEKDIITEVIEDTERCTHQVRSMLCDLRELPGGVDFFAKLSHLAESIPHEGMVRLKVRTSGRAPCFAPAREHQILSIVREALRNAIRHSGAALIEVECQGNENSASSSSVDLRIRDNGKGFDPGACRGDHFGLTGMRERATEIGADFHVFSDPCGTTIQLKVKLNTLVRTAA